MPILNGGAAPRSTVGCASRAASSDGASIFGSLLSWSARKWMVSQAFKENSSLAAEPSWPSISVLNRWIVLLLVVVGASKDDTLTRSSAADPSFWMAPGLSVATAILPG